MAHYDYRCTDTKCGYTMSDVYQSIKEKPLTKCPQCRRATFERIISGGLMVVVKEVKTIGSAIDKNQRINKNKLAEADHKKAEENPGPKKEWFQSEKYRTATNREVARMSNARRRKYVLEGK